MDDANICRLFQVVLIIKQREKKIEFIHDLKQIELFAFAFSTSRKNWTVLFKMKDRDKLMHHQ